MPNTLKCLTVFSSHGNWISCKGVSVHHTDSFANTETRPYAVHFLLHDAAAKVYVHGSFTYSSTCMSSTLRRIPAWPASSRICHESLYQIPTTRGRSSMRMRLPTQQGHPGSVGSYDDPDDYELTNITQAHMAPVKR
ncbi:hypothetical protein K449DRAFT_467697 [Hypoxylon sp. EC38]|nr:hypothetical protein K449DRAFT_467697 [Hypoxylon sp. EC38]